MITTSRSVRIAAAAALTVAALGGCSSSDTSAQKQKRQNYEAAEKAVPFPAGVVARNPLERRNAAEKLKRDSDPARLSYIYLLSLDGKVISHFVAKGKVSSADSQLLPTQDIKDPCASDYCPTVVDASGDDGTYGAREPGIFFFTPQGQMVTWSGDYIQSDRPLSIKTPISLVAEAK